MDALQGKTLLKWTIWGYLYCLFQETPIAHLGCFHKVRHDNAGVTTPQRQLAEEFDVHWAQKGEGLEGHMSY